MQKYYIATVKCYLAVTDPVSFCAPCEADEPITERTWLDYRMPLIHNVADSKEADVITESYQVGRSFRTKEVGEGLVSAILAAIANAIYDATGLRMYTTPFSPEKVLKGIKLLNET